VPSFRAPLLALVLLPVGAAGARAQTLTLAEALSRADRTAYPNRVAAALSAEAEGRATGALRGMVPTVRAENGWARTTDPLGAFGATLRQRLVTPAAFEPARLNDPAPISNFGSAVVVELPLLDPGGLLGRDVAVRGREAAGSSEEWTRTATRADVIRAYFGAVLADEQVATLEAGLASARGHAREADALHRNGVVTRSDVLLAEVKAGELEADLSAARSGMRLARRRLAVVLGTPADTAFTLPDSLPSAAVVRGVAGQAAADLGSPETRADVRAAGLGAAAARADAARARAALLPRLATFGRLDWSSASGPYFGRESWTLGVMLDWRPFSGGAELGEVQAARGRRAAAEAQAEATTAQARLEASQADDALGVALERLGIAERAAAQSAEAHRIVARKYEGGVASVVELLDAAAAETRSRLAFSQARYDVIAAATARRQALGLDFEVLDALDR
jgi:outer membrane protein TolC